MTYEFVKYPGGTKGVFSSIGKNENDEEYLRVTFERSTKNGFDTYVIEIPSYEIVLDEGNYTEEEKKFFIEIAKNGSAFFLKYARLGGLNIS